MAMRSPSYLDLDTLISLAEYHDVVVPHEVDVIEKSISRRDGRGRVNVPGLVEAAGGGGMDVEYQSSYRLAPRQKASVSKILDALLEAGHATWDLTDRTALTKNLLVEIDGRTRIASASLAGKMFHLIKRLVGESGIDGLLDVSAPDSDMMQEFQRIYLTNELVPIPTLLEMTQSQLPQRVYIDLKPDQFVDAASANRLEGEYQVLGTVTHLIPGGPDGFLSAENWLLHDWEYLIRRKLMTSMGTMVRDLVEALELDIPVDDQPTYITGPAIIISAVAMY